MKIMVINPNTSVSMTDEIAAAARQVASPGVEIIATNPVDGPISIEGHYDDVYAAVGVLDCIAQGEKLRVHGYVIACGNDPALLAAREMTKVPVVGIGEAAMHVAAMLGGHFTVITTLQRTNVQLEENVLRYGFSSLCRTVRSVDLPVLDLHGAVAYERLRDAIRTTVAQDRAETIVLACAGMASFAQLLTKDLGLPVIDGVQAGTRLIEALVGLGLGTSKISSFAPPLPKEYLGLYAAKAPPKNGQSDADTTRRD